MDLNIKQRLIHRREKNVVVFRYLNYTNDNLFASSPSSEYVDRAKREGKNNTGYRFHLRKRSVSNTRTKKGLSREKESIISSHVCVDVDVHEDADAHPPCRRRLRLGARARVQVGHASDSQPVVKLAACGGFRA